MTNLFDSHCHIQLIGDTSSDQTSVLWGKLGLTQEEVIQQAIGSGAKQMMVVGCNLSDSRLAVNLATKYPRLYASAGIHPHEADKFADNPLDLEGFSQLAKNKEVKAIGECGLDYFYLHSTKANQKKIFEFQLDQALSLNLPLIFHVREAYDDFWPILDKFMAKGKVNGVLHSFTDNAANLSKALDRGLYIGVNGIATFTKDPSQLEVYKSIPKHKLILETDAPGYVNQLVQIHSKGD